jgi:hypothetical protein
VWLVRGEGLRAPRQIDYHKDGMRTPISRFAAFASASDQALEGFPTVARTLPPAPALGPHASALEQRYPTVVQSLTLLWGHPEMNQYFEKISSGQDASLNLDPAAMAEVMLLAAVHQRICPYRPAKRVDEIYGAGRWADPWKPARPRR